MNAAILTNEFPPEIYGGAGIHVKFLTQELAKLCHIEARCFGVQNVDENNIHALGFSRKLGLNPEDDRFQKIFKPIDIDLQWAASLKDIDVIHCHTWYSHFGGVLASRLLQCPLILTTHSLEPHRPWKAEQLGDGGYAMSCWIERTAYEAADGVIAVSEGMKRDVMKLYGVPEDRVKVIYNGIDPDFYAPTFDEKILEKWGVDPKRPYVLFVGRITRQKGISQLIQAIPQIDKSAQVVLCAGAPDTIELADECKALENERERAEGLWDGVVIEMQKHQDQIKPDIPEHSGAMHAEFKEGIELDLFVGPFSGSALVVHGLPSIAAPGRRKCRDECYPSWGWSRSCRIWHRSRDYRRNTFRCC